MFLHKINQSKRKKPVLKILIVQKIWFPFPGVTAVVGYCSVRAGDDFLERLSPPALGARCTDLIEVVIIPKTASSVVQGCSFTNGFKVICRWVTATRGNPILPPALPLPRDWAPPLMSAVALGGAHWACQGANLTKKKMIFCLFGFQLIWAGSADQFLILFTTVSQRKWWKHAAMLKGKKLTLQLTQVQQ